MIRAYRCAALDTPLAYIRKKIEPRPPVGGRSAARRAVFRPPGQILARKFVFCYCTPDFHNGPFVTLDDIFDLAPSDSPFVTLFETVDLAPLDRFLNFSFLSYGLKWHKMAILRRYRLKRESTPNFGPISMKLGPVVRFTKKMTLNKVLARFGSKLRRNGRLFVGPKREQMAKTPFFAI
jgi:hypothetical protein